MGIEEKYLIDYTFFIEELMEYLDKNYSLSEFGFYYDDDDIDELDDLDIKEKELKEFIDEVKAKQLSQKTKDRLALIEDFICSVDGEEEEVIETSEGYSFLFSKLGPLIWLSYEGDVYRYFRSEKAAYEFLKKW